mmetsp:Transcript_35352/g.67615  ORF Transcript_35352/g.67615 Transcript_35352/m.67615 type:complete len:170 (-) Transcript_35352:328-837(-)
MSDSAKLGSTNEAHHASRKAAHGMAGRGTPPPSKRTAAEEPGEGGAVGPRSTHTTHSSGGGKHAYARAQMGKLNQQRDSMSQEKPGRELPQAFQLPPVVTEQFSRTASFAKRVFSLEAILEPLPTPLKTSLSRNFGFFTRIFTQFTNPQHKKEMVQSLPGFGPAKSNRS